MSLTDRFESNFLIQHAFVATKNVPSTHCPLQCGRKFELLISNRCKAMH
ncbi:hypothetical protein RBWH47_01878 [Rhodopirellula baltica WH47]|uniref:Uncharacterized protein n=1 Tax=Rhodopirellula baltica WH47 TaxID=991778 RepID=F2B261_RHOBT|nr:hypothetical protein RBWH47_01878 [Rhodopirellula baltica WH47]